MSSQDPRGAAVLNPVVGFAVGINTALVAPLLHQGALRSFGDWGSFGQLWPIALIVAASLLATPLAWAGGRRFGWLVATAGVAANPSLPYWSSSLVGSVDRLEGPLPPMLCGASVGLGLAGLVWALERRTGRVMVGGAFAVGFFGGPSLASLWTSARSGG